VNVLVFIDMFTMGHGSTQSEQTTLSGSIDNNVETQLEVQGLVANSRPRPTAQKSAPQLQSHSSPDFIHPCAYKSLYLMAGSSHVPNGVNATISGDTFKTPHPTLK
jgi:hypothetical protein